MLFSEGSGIATDDCPLANHLQVAPVCHISVPPIRNSSFYLFPFSSDHSSCLKLRNIWSAPSPSVSQTSKCPLMSLMEKSLMVSAEPWEVCFKESLLTENKFLHCDYEQIPVCAAKCLRSQCSLYDFMLSLIIKRGSFFCFFFFRLTHSNVLCCIQVLLIHICK